MERKELAAGADGIFLPPPSGAEHRGPHRLPGGRADLEGFLAGGERLLQRTRAKGRPLGLMVLHVHDLLEVEALFGRAVAQRASHSVMVELTLLARDRGIVGRTTRETFAVLVVGPTGGELHAMLRRRLGRACALELPVSGEEIVLLPHVHACTIGPGEQLEVAYRGAYRAIKSQRYIDELRQEYLRREREAHSTHMGLPPHLAEAPATRRAGDAPGWRQTFAATMPLPFDASLPER
jgi:hypothetical protein